MVALIGFVPAALASPFKSKSRLEAENAVLRHQRTGLRRKVRGRAHLTNNDRGFFVQMYRWFPSILKVVTIIEPETLVRWYRAGFRCYWRWKSRPRGGRPQIEIELRALIRQMSTDNQLWGAPRIHDELLSLGLASRNQRNPLPGNAVCWRCGGHRPPDEKWGERPLARGQAGVRCAHLCARDRRGLSLVLQTGSREKAFALSRAGMTKKVSPHPVV
jgi:hypothetical protein